jgi:hypothetical protein
VHGKQERFNFCILLLLSRVSQVIHILSKTNDVDHMRNIET